MGYNIGMDIDKKEKNKEYFKRWYESNKETQYKRIKDRKEKIKSDVRDYKESNPCFDCGQFFHHFVMDFDHREPSTKSANVSNLIGSGSIKKIWEEIDKCDLLCANCHRVRTWKSLEDKHNL